MLSPALAEKEGRPTVAWRGGTGPRQRADVHTVARSNDKCKGGAGEGRLVLIPLSTSEETQR